MGTQACSWLAGCQTHYRADPCIEGCIGFETALCSARKGAVNTKDGGVNKLHWPDVGSHGDSTPETQS